MTENKTLHVWKIPLNISESEVKNLFGILSDEEKKIANRFKFEKHRRRYIVSHAAMRKILATQLNISLHDLKINTDVNGKPYITKNPLYFNLSHSEELALLAVFSQGPVGVDVEHLNPIIDVLGISERFFHLLEFDQLKKMKPENLENYFYYCWTAKEAFLKAKGLGIANHLKMFALDIQDLKKIKIIFVSNELEEFINWNIYPFQPADNYIATAVCSITPEGIAVYEY